MTSKIFFFLNLRVKGKPNKNSRCNSNDRMAHKLAHRWYNTSLDNSKYAALSTNTCKYICIFICVSYAKDMNKIKNFGQYVLYVNRWAHGSFSRYSSAKSYVCYVLNQQMEPSTGWSKSLCAPDDCTVIVRCTDFLITLYNSFTTAIEFGLNSLKTRNPRFSNSRSKLRTFERIAIKGRKNLRRRF